MIEDDPLKRSLALDTYSEDYMDTFDLRFIICEQQFCDLLDKNIPIKHYFSQNKSDPRWVPIWNPITDIFPSIFAMDMMICWDDRDYQSGRPQPEVLPENRAGLRIARQLLKLRAEHNFKMIIWTAIDCRDIAGIIDHELGAELFYKDAMRLRHLFDHIKNRLKL